MDGGELGIRNDLRWAVGIPTGTESAAYLFKVRSLASQRLRTREGFSKRNLSGKNPFK
jgi:hypothetical protein